MNEECAAGEEEDASPYGPIRGQWEEGAHGMGQREEVSMGSSSFHGVRVQPFSSVYCSYENMFTRTRPF